MALAIKRCGGQSELARLIKRRYGTEVSPQRIQYLANATAAKPAKGSRITAQIASVAGLRPEWLASGTGPRDEIAPAAFGRSGIDPLRAAKLIDVKVVGTKRRIKMELTQEAIEVAKAFMDLPARERMRFQRAILVAALPHQRDVPDEELQHLAAPTAGKRKVGTQ